MVLVWALCIPKPFNPTAKIAIIAKNRRNWNAGRSYILQFWQLPFLAFLAIAELFLSLYQR
jgi:hypothetical protein